MRCWALAVVFVFATGCSLRSQNCGYENDLCCEGASCQGGLECRAGVCAQPLNCEEKCAAGSQRCTADQGIELCSQAQGACPLWQTVVAQCPGSQRCRQVVGTPQAECADACPARCALQAVVCSAGGPLICQIDTVTGCPSFQSLEEDPRDPLCVKGACADNVCWENPTPLAGDLVSVAGWDIAQFVAIDSLGNLLEYNAGSWTYLLEEARLTAVADCDIPGRYVAVGTLGALYFGTHADWKKEAAPDPTARFFGAACTSNFVAVAVGANGAMVVRNTLGNWFNVASGTTTQLNGVVVRNFQGEAWAVGEGGTIVHCLNVDNVNGNVICNPETSGTTTGLRSAWVDENDGRVYAVGGGGLVLERTGTGWAPVAVGKTAQNLRDVDGIAGGSVLVVGEGGTVLKRVNDSWSVQEVLAPVQWNGAALTSEDEPVLVGADGHVVVDDNGGVAPWLQQGGRTLTRETLSAVHGVSSSDAYAVGDDGTLLHRLGDVWRAEAVGRYSHDFTAVYAVSADEVYVAGNDASLTGKGVIVARRDGQWDVEAAALPLAPLRGLASDGVNLVTVGQGGTWLEKPLGAAGTAWAPVAHNQGSAHLYAVAARAKGVTGSSEVIAVGEGCTVIRKVGSAFIKDTVPMCDGALTVVWAGSDGDAYIGGAEGQLFHRTSQGWEREYPGCAYETVTGLTGGNGVMFATCSNSTLFQRANGSWRVENESMAIGPLLAAWLSPQGDTFVVGAGGTVLRRR